MRTLNIIFVVVVALVLCAFAVKQSPKSAVPANAAGSGVLVSQQTTNAGPAASVQPQNGDAAANRANSAQNATARNESAQAGSNLPNTSSALPLISVIGFGVLVGGIASALKTR
jgi:hypothetical protein